jgi:hypothetical protein
MERRTAGKVWSVAASALSYDGFPRADRIARAAEESTRIEIECGVGAVVW